MAPKTVQSQLSAFHQTSKRVTFDKRQRTIGDPMLTLILARHAKRTEPSVSDHERPLNNRGLRQAPLLGERLNQSGYAPTLIISSDARRTEETALLLQSTWTEVELIYDHRLYLGSLSDIAHTLNQFAHEERTVCVVGHNPGFSVAAALLGKTSVELKTACAAVLTSTASTWAGLSKTTTLNSSDSLKVESIRRQPAPTNLNHDDEHNAFAHAHFLKFLATASARPHSGRRSMGLRYCYILVAPNICVSTAKFQFAESISSLSGIERCNDPAWTTMGSA